MVCRMRGINIKCMPYYIYLKTHTRTGLKYLGQTCQDPYIYRGSGKRWINHLSVHGNDVRTEILNETNDYQNHKKECLKYSKIYDVVNNSQFANIVEENGSGGDTSKSPNYIKAMKNRNQIVWNTGLKTGPMPEETKSKISKTLKEHWKRHTHNRKGIAPWNKGASTEYNGALESTRTVWTCPHCGKSGKGSGNAKRWHFDNCKSLTKNQ